MGKSYMPTKLGDQITWFQTFVNVVSPSPLGYGIPNEQWTPFLQGWVQLQTLWQASIEPSTRTRGVIRSRDNQLELMREKAGKLISLIQGTPSVTDQMKIDAGVTVRKTEPTPTPIVLTSPIMKVKKVEQRNVTIDLYRNEAKRGKPPGAILAMIFTHVGPTRPENLEQWVFCFSTGKTTVEIPFPPSETGQTAWLTAFWQNNRKESGPAAEPISVNLPAASVLPGGATELKKAA